VADGRGGAIQPQAHLPVLLAGAMADWGEVRGIEPGSGGGQRTKSEWGEGGAARPEEQEARRALFGGMRLAASSISCASSGGSCGAGGGARAAEGRLAGEGEGGGGVGDCAAAAAAAVAAAGAELEVPEFLAQFLVKNYLGAGSRIKTQSEKACYLAAVEADEAPH
jgi:hypothetical protein